MENRTLTYTHSPHTKAPKTTRQIMLHVCIALIPAIVIFGGETILYPGDVPIAEIYAAGGASAIWSKYIRYIGAGAVAAAGIERKSGEKNIATAKQIATASAVRPERPP